jgi:hypothetical protein
METVLKLNLFFWYFFKHTSDLESKMSNFDNNHHVHWPVFLMIILSLALASVACFGRTNELLGINEDDEGSTLGEYDAPEGDEPTEEDHASTSVWSGDGGGWPSKPVRFANNGTEAYTVQPWTFQPLTEYHSANIPHSSTVVFTGGSNPSSNLSLWLGTYTWCYFWEVGDTDGDGIMNYQHAIDNRPILLNEEDPDDVEKAEIVTLAPPPSNGILPGNCSLEGITAIIWTGENDQYAMVEITNGTVVNGRTHGNFESWLATGGKYEGTELYVKWERVGGATSGCALKEEWYTTGDGIITLNRGSSCGIETTGPVEYQRWR